MAYRILKWTLAITDRQTISMPSNATVLTVQMVHGSPQLWAQCGALGKDMAKRTIACYETGEELPAYPGRYIATIQTKVSELHVFEAPVDTALDKWEDTIRNWTHAEVVA